MKREDFDKWFSENYYNLKTKCITLNFFGECLYKWQEDVFHNTYIAIIEKKDFQKTDDFENLFISSFKIYCKRAIKAVIKEIVPEEIFWTYQASKEQEEQEEQEKKQIRNDFAIQILFVARQIFSSDEYTIFKLYFENSMNFKEIGDFFGVTGNSVAYRYNKLCTKLNGMFSEQFNLL